MHILLFKPIQMYIKVKYLIKSLDQFLILFYFISINIDDNNDSYTISNIKINLYDIIEVN